MNESELKEFARAYVGLSNAHCLDLILPMFSVDAVYSSTNVGEYQGRQAIGQMMRGFFERYPDVHWQTREFGCEAGGWVVFKFLMTASEPSSSTRLERSGIERLQVDGDGRIARLQVDTE